MIQQYQSRQMYLWLKENRIWTWVIPRSSLMTITIFSAQFQRMHIHLTHRLFLRRVDCLLDWLNRSKSNNKTTLKWEKEMKIFSKKKKSRREFKNSQRSQIRLYNTSITIELHVIQLNLSLLLYRINSEVISNQKTSSSIMLFSWQRSLHRFLQSITVCRGKVLKSWTKKSNIMKWERWLFNTWKDRNKSNRKTLTITTTLILKARTSQDWLIPEHI